MYLVWDLQGSGARNTVEYLVFAVKQQQVSKGDGREGRLLQQEGQLLETLRRLRVHVQQSLVVECHWVQLLQNTHIHTSQLCSTGYNMFHASVKSCIETKLYWVYDTNTQKQSFSLFPSGL